MYEFRIWNFFWVDIFFQIPTNRAWDFRFWGEEVQGGEKWDDRYSMVEVLPFVFSFQGRRLLQASKKMKLTGKKKRGLLHQSGSVLWIASNSQ